MAATAAELPCIRCGACSDACPAGLQPQQLLRDLLAERPGVARGHGLMDCSECGRCDLACPSRIALSARFVAAKQAALARERVLEIAAAARARFEARGERLQRDAEERARREASL